MRSRPRIVAVSSRLGGQRRLSNLYRAVVHSRALRTRHALCAVLANDEVRVDDALQHFYTQEYDESVRLVRTPHGRLEAARTRELLAAALPQPPARILDVGGGPGHHAQWMADQGYDVTLLDVVESHVLAARASGLDAAVGDARRLEEPDGTVNAVLLLGPLYHLDDAGRAAALEEAHRVLRPGGLLAAAAISRWAALIDIAATGPWDDDTVTRLASIVDTGVHDTAVGFTTSWTHTPDQLDAEVAAAGFVDVDVIGIEGPLGHVLDHLEMPDALERAITVARITEREAALAGASPHLLALARRPGQAAASA
jgi:SAM-dependent methyltransferase